jgi:IS30 family transposase
MRYQQITTEERYTFSAHRKQGLPIAQIAVLMGRHKSSLYREFNRNKSTRGHYATAEADSMTRGRRRLSRRNKHYTKIDFVLVTSLLRKKMSPEQIVGFIRRFKLMKRRLSHETIYKYIWQDKADGGNLWTHLRQSTKRRRKRYKAYDSRGRLATKRHISDRPKSVETRKYKGHWEIDTVHGRGSRHCIVTLVERKTGYVMIGKLPNKTASALNKKTIELIAEDPLGFKTITSDNGTEFHQYQAIEDCCRTKFYFANPYHSWERGSNENMNGLIRQYLPKTESMRCLTQKRCDAIAAQLNSRPRKRLNYKTPEEMYHGK